MENQETEIIKLIKSRRSIRKYQDRPVEDEKIKALLEAAMAAPSACNSQPWEFIVVTEQTVLDALKGKLRFARYNAPLAVVVCGNTGIAHNSAAKHFWVQDCAAAVENMLLAAVGMRLGSVWIGIHPLPGTVKAVQKILNIPEEVIPLAMVYAGYPAEEKRARSHYDEHRIHWQTYEEKKRRAKKKNAKHEV